MFPWAAGSTLDVSTIRPAVRTKLELPTVGAMIIRDLDRDMGHHATAIGRMETETSAQGDGPVREATSKQKE